jgi:hypothetical protein
MSYTITLSKKKFEEYQRLRETATELLQDDNSDEEQGVHKVLESALKNFTRLSKTKRKGPYSCYGKAKIRKLFEYYFVDHLTVKEACTVLDIKERTAYNYIKKLKVMNLPNIFSKRAGFSREKQLEGLSAQMAAINLY